MLAALTETYAAVTATVSALTDAEWTQATRCEGWCVGDVLYHLLLDPRRTLVAFASPTAQAATTDLVEYWRRYRPGREGAARHAEYVRRAAAAYPDHLHLVEEWEETSAAALRAAAAAIASGADESGGVNARVRTQGLVIAVPDLLATLTVEAALHLLDLTVHLPHPHPVPPTALDTVRLTLNGLLGTPLPRGWDPLTGALKGTGRAPLDAGDGAQLGPLADRFPLLA